MDTDFERALKHFIEYAFSSPPKEFSPKKCAENRENCRRVFYRWMWVEVAAFQLQRQLDDLLTEKDQPSQWLP